MVNGDITELCDVLAGLCLPNPPLLPCGRLCIFVLSIDAPVDSAV